jgi:hypothetical protein
MPLPAAGLAVIPTAARANRRVTSDLGCSTDVGDEYVDTRRPALKVHLLESGHYLAIVKGDFTGQGVNAQTWFGSDRRRSTAA